MDIKSLALKLHKAYDKYLRLYALYEKKLAASNKAQENANQAYLQYMSADAEHDQAIRDKSLGL